MHQAYCDNCGCAIDKDHQEGSCALDVAIPETRGVDENAPIGRDGKANFDLCECCADGIISLLTRNRQRLAALHGVDCEDILPFEYRCVHAK